MNSLHRWWLWGCFIATLLASWAGGFGVAVTAVFIGIYLTGLVLIGPDEPEAAEPRSDDVGEDVTGGTAEEIGEEADAEPYPEDDEPDPAETESTQPDPDSVEPDKTDDIGIVEIHDRSST